MRSAHSKDKESAHRLCKLMGHKMKPFLLYNEREGQTTYTSSCRKCSMTAQVIATDQELPTGPFHGKAMLCFCKGKP